MTIQSIIRRGAPKPVLGTAIAAALAATLVAGSPSPVAAAPSERASNTLTLSLGRGQLVQLKSPMSDLFVADDKVADVQVRSPTQLYIFAKGAGETTIYATSKSGAVVYSANVRVGNNLDNVQTMLRLAMPDAAIVATPMNGVVLLTGTVATPEDVEEASRLVQAFVGKETQVISRLKMATPMQVNLRVRIAEVSRDFGKTIGVNLGSFDRTGGFQFGIAQGRGASPQYTPGGGLFAGGTQSSPGTSFLTTTGVGSTIGLAGRFLGLDLLGALDLAESDGLSHTLAEPNLTALSGETASFLAGGEIPIPVPQFEGTTTIEYKQYGVSLAFTPTVLADGRISMRVRPEVSTLTASTVAINGYNIPGLTTRRAETTVELGSGQSFVIGGLLSNNVTNNIDKTPFLGDLPVLGALFRSQGFRRQQTELVIVITPYLVRPTSSQTVSLPTDGYRAPTDFQRIIGGQTFSGKSRATAPQPRAAPVVTAPGGSAAPDTGALAPGAMNAAPAASPGTKSARAAAPGFTFN